jgi:hypothetical protein
MRIGSIKGNIFSPTNHLSWCIEGIENIPELTMTTDIWEQMLAQKFAKIDIDDGYYVLKW